MRLPLKKPELVAPAGDWAALNSAIASGCDSVYFGIKGLTMRNLAGNFDILEINKVMDRLRQNGCRGYLALNVIVYEREAGKVRRIINAAKEAGVDGIICWDMAVLSLAKEAGLRIHLSTQASVSNFPALKVYAAQGVQRVVLAREMRLSDIARIAQKIKKEKVDCEIEAFVHGAMCLSISGRCFLSEYSFSQSANRGRCLQPCRRQYRIRDVGDECEYVLGEDYILSPKDLCALEFLDRLIEAGIDAFKIEGRMRSPEYVGAVTLAYRKAIDAYFSGTLSEKVIARLMQSVSAVYNRGFSSGFYLGRPKASTSRALENSHEKIYIGEVGKFYKKIGVAEITVRNHALTKGDQIVCVGKTTPASFARVDEMQINHVFVDSITRGQVGGIKLPFPVRRGDKIFIWRRRPSCRHTEA